MPGNGRGRGKSSQYVHNLRRARAGALSAGILQRLADLPGLSRRRHLDQRPVLALQGAGLKVPAGVEDGTRIRYSELGDVGVHGGRYGDLYVVLHVKEHPFFLREGKDLYCVLPISYAQAALGAEVKVPTLDGEHLLKIPEGTQSGKELHIRGKGVPVLNGHGKGDLVVRVVVQTPSRLSKRERELLQELDAVSRVENKPERPTLLSKVKDIFG